MGPKYSCLGSGWPRAQGMAPNSVAKGSWWRVGDRSEELMLMEEVFFEVQVTSMRGTCSLTFPEPLGWEEEAVKVI